METIHILGIGWHEDELTLGAIKHLRSDKKIVLRTGRCECAAWLEQEQIPFETLDDLYEQCEDFDELIEESACKVLELAENEEIVYCVNDLTDKTCAYICREAEEAVKLIPGVSEGSRLLPFAGEDVRIISASDADVMEADVRISTLIREIDSPMLASDIKLKLTERYPDELDIFVCDADGRIFSVPLYELDQLECYDHRMCALIPAVRSLDALERYDVHHLEEIMRRLRDFDGCPWDREQTHESLRPYLLEEACEAIDAINREDTDDLYDELGDVLLQVIFHAEIARQYGEFELSDITTAICKKMIRRHPHVFGQAHADTSDDVRDQWDEIKKQEKSQTGGSDALKAVAKSLPALMRAAKVAKRARKNGGNLPSLDDAWSAWQAHADEETTGRLLLCLADRANTAGIDPELALLEAVQRYIDEFERTEKK